MQMLQAIYPGTFDPFSLGHLDLVERASKMFDHLIVAISDNIHKGPLFNLEQRMDMAKLAIKGMSNVEVIGFEGLLVDVMRDYNIRFVIRGIRGLIDFEYEFQMAQINRSMLKGYEPVFLMPGEKYMVLNSTIIRDITRHGGDVYRFVPTAVCEYIRRTRGLE